MTYEEIDQLLKNHTSVRLMKADNAPLIISFLFHAFKEDVPYIQNHARQMYPKAPAEYLTD